MVIQEMTDQECRATLARTNLARLACARNNQPYIVPVHVNLEGDYLYGYSTLGQKIEWMRQNPLVCLESDELITHGQWATVVVFGHYEELPNTPEYAGPRGVAERLFQRHPMWWEPASVPLAAHEQRTRIVFRIRIGRLTGRRAASAPANTALSRGNASGARPRRSLAQILRRMVGRQSNV
jgi:nitroimidazol reductase NimA-like FMN-containing flavoprotein (pyridoxamine 5'-phosphate oxidase superfamily)